MSAHKTKTAACGLGPAPRSRRWSDEDAERLEWLYTEGGDKACIPMRIIALELGRTEAACWAKLRRIFNANDQDQP